MTLSWAKASNYGDGKPASAKDRVLLKHQQVLLFLALPQVWLGSSTWSSRAISRSKVDKYAPHTHHVKLRSWQQNLRRTGIASPPPASTHTQPHTHTATPPHPLPRTPTHCHPHPRTPTHYHHSTPPKSQHCQTIRLPDFQTFTLPHFHTSTPPLPLPLSPPQFLKQRLDTI